MYSSGPLHMDEQRLDDQQICVDTGYRTCRERWMIEIGGEKESRKSVKAAWHDDDENITYFYYYERVEIAVWEKDR